MSVLDPVVDLVLDPEPERALGAARRLVRRFALPGAPPAARALIAGDVVLLGEGEDFRAFRAGDLVVRVAKRPESAAWLAAEPARLARLAPRLPLGIPRYLATLPDLALDGPPAEDPAGASAVQVGAYAVLRGTPGDAFDAPLDLPPLAPGLGRFLAALHGAPVDGAPSSGDLFRPGPYRDRVVAAGGLGRLPAPLAARARAFLAGPPPPDAPGPLRLVHGDLEAEHVLVDPATGAPCAVIDWSDVALADPARDFGALLAWGGEPFVDAVLAAYSPEPDPGFRARVRHLGRCFAILDAVEALDEGPAALAAAVRRLERALATLPGESSD